jgi:uncharacterized protein
MDFVIYQDAAKEWRWRLWAPNNRVMADSGEGYKHKDDCIDAIKLIKNGVPSAKAWDISQKPAVAIPV